MIFGFLEATRILIKSLQLEKPIPILNRGFSHFQYSSQCCPPHLPKNSKTHNQRTNGSSKIVNPPAIVKRCDPVVNGPKAIASGFATFVAKKSQGNNECRITLMKRTHVSRRIKQ
jgi:hypothetical protein